MDINLPQVVAEVTAEFERYGASQNLEFQRDGSDRIGRQSQTWMRTPDGWRVVSAHVSLMT